VNVISKRGLTALLKGKSSDVVEAVFVWYRTARVARWQSLQDVRKSFPEADLVGRVLIFNIREIVIG
jgi:hypothetical protein